MSGAMMAAGAGLRSGFGWLRSVRMFPLVMAACLAFTACADMSNMTPAEQAIERSKRRFVATTAEGAVAGALLGAALGYALGGGRGALVGAAAGGATGGVAGAMVAQNNYRRSQTEGNLNAAILDASKQAADARADASNATQMASEARQGIAQMKLQLRAGQISSADYNAKIAHYRTDLANLQDLSKSLGDQVANMRQNAGMAGSRGAGLSSAANDIAASKSRVDRAANDVYTLMAAEPS